MDEVLQKDEDLHLQNVHLKAEIYDLKARFKAQNQHAFGFIGQVAKLVGVEPDQAGVLNPESVLSAIKSLKDGFVSVQG